MSAIGSALMLANAIAAPLPLPTVPNAIAAPLPIPAVPIWTPTGEIQMPVVGLGSVFGFTPPGSTSKMILDCLIALNVVQSYQSSHDVQCCQIVA
jgi:hypothetical protein